MPQIRKMQKEDIPQMAEIAAASFTDPWTEKGFTEAFEEAGDDTTLLEIFSGATFDEITYDEALKEADAEK